MQGGKQGMSDVKEGVGGDVGENKLSQTEEERLNELLQMAATSIVDGRHVTVGGLKTLSIFVQISIQRSLSKSFSTTSLPSLLPAGSFFIFSSPRTFLVFQLIFFLS